MKDLDFNIEVLSSSELEIFNKLSNQLKKDEYIVVDQIAVNNDFFTIITKRKDDKASENSKIIKQSTVEELRRKYGKNK